MAKTSFEEIITNGEKIMKTNYPPIGFLIRNLIQSKGLVIFAGAAKVGKSLFMTQMLDAVTGNCNQFLGFEVDETGPVLYLALEDSENRIKERFLKQHLIPNSNFNIAFKWSIDEKAVSDLEEYLTLHPETKLIVIDTKAKICKEQGVKACYQDDYNFLGSIKSCADRHDICILLVTHLRKRPAEEDVFNEINGSSAIMGVADTIMILKRSRNQNRGVLSITSRDFQEREEEIYLNYETLTWHSNGEASNVIPNMTPERQQILTALKELGGTASPKDIAEKLHKDNKVIGNLLAKMVSYGFVKKSNAKRGFWVLPSFTDEDSDVSDSEDDYVLE